MAKNERADRYEAKDIGTYAGAQGPQKFNSMYPNLNMPQGVMDYRYNTAPVSSLTYSNNNSPQAMENFRGYNQAQNPNSGMSQLAPSQQGGGMQGGGNSMMPSQGQMPNFMQMAMQRYQGNQANGGMGGMQPPMQPPMPTPGQGIDESGGGMTMQPTPEMLQQLLAQRSVGGFNPLDGRARAGNPNPLMPQQAN